MVDSPEKHMKALAKGSAPEYDHCLYLTSGPATETKPQEFLQKKFLPNSKCGARTEIRQRNPHNQKRPTILINAASQPLQSADGFTPSFVQRAGRKRYSLQFIDKYIPTLAQLCACMRICLPGCALKLGACFQELASMVSSENKQGSMLRSRKCYLYQQ